MSSLFLLLRSCSVAFTPCAIVVDWLEFSVNIAGCWLGCCCCCSLLPPIPAFGCDVRLVCLWCRFLSKEVSVDVAALLHLLACFLTFDSALAIAFSSRFRLLAISFPAVTPRFFLFFACVFLFSCFFQVTSKDGKPSVEVSVSNNDKKVFSPEEISAMLLTKMKETAEVRKQSRAEVKCYKAEQGRAEKRKVTQGDAKLQPKPKQSRGRHSRAGHRRARQSRAQRSKARQSKTNLRERSEAPQRPKNNSHSPFTTMLALTAVSTTSTLTSIAHVDPHNGET